MSTDQARILEFARLTLQIEIDTLQALRQEINSEFARCVDHLYHSRGRLVVTGVGKSAITGQKIAATCNSTGTAALFMHAADAIHGDLGMIGPDDTILCLSKSGETPEIKVLVPLLRNMGVPIIAMTGNRSSYLALQADYILYTPIEKEADPNNLAPTASTTAQVALGDAMAVALLQLRGFEPKDFALLHPGGSLGKQLYLRVRDLYKLHSAPAVGPDASMQDVILTMTSGRLGCTAVVDSQNKLLGVITDGDLRRMLEHGKALAHTKAKEVMHTTPKVIQEDQLAVEALSQLRTFHISQVIVTQTDGTYQGILHLHDLVREGLL